MNKEFTEEEIKRYKLEFEMKLIDSVMIMENHHCDPKGLLNSAKNILEYIKQLESQVEYDGYYQSYILGMTTKEEFEEISNRFMVENEEH